MKNQYIKKNYLIVVSLREGGGGGGGGRGVIPQCTLCLIESSRERVTY